MNKQETQHAYNCARSLARSIDSHLTTCVPEKLNAGQSAAMRLICRRLEAAIGYVHALKQIKQRKNTQSRVGTVRRKSRLS